MILYTGTFEASRAGPSFDAAERSRETADAASFSGGRRPVAPRSGGGGAPASGQSRSSLVSARRRSPGLLTPLTASSPPRAAGRTPVKIILPSIGPRLGVDAAASIRIVLDDRCDLALRRIGWLRSWNPVGDRGSGACRAVGDRARQLADTRQLEAYLARTPRRCLSHGSRYSSRGGARRDDPAPTLQLLDVCGPRWQSFRLYAFQGPSPLIATSQEHVIASFLTSFQAHGTDAAPAPAVPRSALARRVSVVMSVLPPKARRAQRNADAQCPFMFSRTTPPLDFLTPPSRVICFGADAHPCLAGSPW